MEQSPKSKSKRPVRDPPPVLFTTPSQNASHVSLEGGLAPVQSNQPSTLYPTASRNSLVHQRSQRLPLRTNLDGPTDTAPITSLPRTGKAPSEGQKQAARTDALWAEMQSTLEEVELSAVNATHVFGPEHSRALEELRKTQIALAQAWARSEADDVVDEGRKGDIGGGTLGSEGKSALDGPGMTATSGTDGGRSTVTSGVHSGGGERMGSKLEEDTKADIVLARKRREANDRYFQRVNEGVLDVVAKLEEVASAMRSVEQESRDIWGDNETMDTASIQSSLP
ncbi:hypothetical protein BCIN_04g05450 [Botrytis cinerea B05.10]|uniref:Uncharacterized protein n=3 Tax=Botryotinia fuckeliana TaxID=40559 RepID=A0A384JG03_BOTFB|nr:hypothetical protein BCIN_04g05450 [Botrytis cinerea B05.10]ATZ49391.1 hypothetical protein BCIN_04g05450 [Botrytis cinerea B05.10]EMR81090.1 hypothetical protein BcDW1_10280 [Botrytis cinerea BcDW1]CCD45024.1 hypothetical protein BofuT4_P007410.1 [Botrytis cinerea T4]